jgi:CHAT domain-containing protein
LALRDRWFQRGLEHHSAGRMDEALAAVQKALALERAVFGRVEAASLGWLSSQARLQEQREQFAGALEARRELWLRQNQEHGPDDWRTIEARLDLEDCRQLARLDERQRRQLQQAEQWNQRVFRLWQKGRSKEALTLAEKALAVRRKILGDKHRKTAVSWLNLGAQHRALTNPAEAERCYERSRVLYKATVGEKHPDYATSLSTLAMLFYQDKGDLARARPLFEQVRDIREAALGKNHPEYASSLNNLAALYQAMGQHRRALPLFQQAVALHEAAQQEKTASYANSLNNLAMLYKDMGDHARALPLFEQAREILAATRGKKHLDYANTLNNLASFYRDRGEFARAIPLQEQARDIRKEVLGEKHPSYAVSLNNLAMLAVDLGDHPRARALLEQARAICKTTLGENHPISAMTLSNLAALDREVGDFARARVLLERVLEIRRTVLGTKHPDFAHALSALALLDEASGQHARAIRLFERARAILEEARGENHPDCADSLVNLGRLHREGGDLVRARSLFEKARQIYKGTVGEKHPTYALCLAAFALLHNEAGDFVQARSFLEHARDILKATRGEKHPEYASSLSKIGLLYQDRGDFARALPLFEQARTIVKASLGEKHRHYALALSNLAVLHRARREYSKALPLMAQALKLQKEVLGEKHPNRAASLNNLATLYQDVGEQARARPLLEEARDVFAAVYGKQHPGYARTLFNLAAFYQDKGDLARAQELLEQALAISRSSLGEKHPSCALCLKNLAFVCLARQDAARARPLLSQALDIEQGYLQAAFSDLSDRQRLDLLARSRFTLGAWLSLPLGADARRDYGRVLAWKAAVGARQAEDRLQRDHLEVAPILRQLRSARSRLALLASRPPALAGQGDWLARFRAVEEEKEKLEVRLANTSAAFRRLRQVDAGRISSALPAGAALVDLLGYLHRQPDPIRKGKWRHEERLVAFVLHPGGRVQRLDLGAVQGIEQAVRRWREPMSSSPPGRINEKAAQWLRQRVWLPIERVLGGARTVMIAPDGPLCGLPFAALPGSRAGSYLLEETTIVQIPSARMLLDREGEAAPAAEGLLALGGLDYGKGASWPTLPGTALETARLTRLYRKRFPSSRAPLLLEGATGDRAGLLKSLSNGKQSWRFLHLATHGFFAPPEKPDLRESTNTFADQRAELTYRRNPLLLSGVVLAGANGDPRSILTAEEVAGLDLRGCDLVVLSACQTGLGRVAGGEGVLGLQRALHLAGAKSAVTSLWSVSDPATNVLMEQFYQRLWGEKKVAKIEALRQAQLYVLGNPDKVVARARELRQQAGAAAELRGVGKKAVPLQSGKATEARSHPAWWAAFLLSGDPR